MLPPDEIRKQIKAVETAFDAIAAQKKEIDIVNAEIAAEHAFCRLKRMIYDYFRQERRDCDGA